MKASADARALSLALADDARNRAGELELPSAEELLAYHEGRLDPDREAAIGRILVASPEAARRLLDVVELAAAEPPAKDAPTELATAAAWRRLAPQLAPSAALAAEAPSPAEAPSLATLARPHGWMALAAALALLSVGLGWRLFELERALRKPVANLATLELPATTRSGAPLSFVLESPGAPLRFVLAPTESCPSYRAELNRVRSGPTVVIDDLRRDSFGLLTFLLPAPSPGEYLVRLSGCERELQTTVFRISATQGGGDG